MSRKALHFYIQTFFIDFMFLNVVFFGLHYYRRGTFVLSQIFYVKLLIAFYFIWMLVSYFTKKFQLRSYSAWSDVFMIVSKNALFLAYGVSLMIVILDLTFFSRLQIYGTVFFLYIGEFVLFTLFYYARVAKLPRVETRPEADEFKKKISPSFSLVLLDFFVLSFLFIGINYVKRGTFVLSEEYQKLLLIIWGLWFLTSLATNKFDKALLDDYKSAISACLKAAILMAFSMAFLIFFLRMFYYSRGQIFGSFVLLFGAEVVFYFLYSNYYSLKKGKGDIESVEDVRSILGQQELDMDSDSQRLTTELIQPVKEKLYHVFDFFNHWLYEFMEKSIPLDRITRARTGIVQTDDIAEIQETPHNSLRLFINLAKVNDVRWVNRYFLEVYGKLRAGGYFVGTAETIRLHRVRFFTRFPKYIAEPLFVLNYLYRRVWPKLNGVNKVYFALTKGRNRLISRAEVLGRLFFCGFDVIAEEEKDDRLYFIAQKVKTPSLDQSPTYGPLVQLNRFGTNGTPMKVYKFRTMYPYSEYLQEYVYRLQSLQRGGKFKDDFRVTELGKFMRSTWIDELPMLYNWLKGDMKLFGVRPLSRQYLSLYDEELQALRSKVKPGLVPPFYADLPVTLDEIKDSERRYIEAYLERPFHTQLTYLWKSFVNIIIRGARSN